MSVALTPETASHTDDVPTRPADLPTPGDRIFRAVSTAAAFVSLFIVGATFLFLLIKSWPVLSEVGPVSFLTGSTWTPLNDPVKVGVGGLIIGTMLIAAIAVVVAAPLAVAMALFINEYAPPRMRLVLTSAVDLLAALPSLMFGMWGFYALQPQFVRISRWVTEHFSAIPLLRRSEVDDVNPLLGLASSSLIAGVVVGMMIIPIVTSVSRDVMAQVPREQCEGALALGGSRWGMIRSVILPFGRSGIVGATLLGFGRALGETIAVALIIVPSYSVNWNLAESGAGSVAGNIVSRFAEAGELEKSALIASGLALFSVTFLVNLGARRIVNKSRLA